MKRMMFLMLVSAAAVCVGCGSDGSSSSTGEDEGDTQFTDDDESKADSTTLPYGTYNHDDFVDAATRGLAIYKSIVLKNDKTFHLVRYGSSGGGEFDGTFVFQTGVSTGKKYMTLTAPGVEPFFFEYKFQEEASGVKGPFLFFRPAKPDRFFIPYKHSDVEWCNAPTDCGVQNYAKPACEVEYTCEANACKAAECPAACDKKKTGETCEHSDECCSDFCRSENKTCL